MTFFQRWLSLSDNGELITNQTFALLCLCCGPADLLTGKKKKQESNGAELNSADDLEIVATSNNDKEKKAYVIRVFSLWDYLSVYGLLGCF